MPGPIPKRSDQRAGHRSKAELSSVDRLPAKAGDDLEAPAREVGFQPRHAITLDLWTSAQNSPQAVYFQETDWATLRLVLLQVDAYADALTGATKRPSANQLDALLGALGRLMFTEGDRRRLRVEIERAGGEVVDDPGVTALADYRSALGL